MTQFKLCAVGDESVISNLQLGYGEAHPFAAPVCFSFDQFDPDAIDPVDTLFLIVDETQDGEARDEKAIKDFIKKIKKIKLFKKSPFILLSNKRDQAFFKQAYKVGALDVISLTQSPEDYEARFLTAMNSFAREQKAEEGAKGAQQVAFDAMQDAAEYGRILQFLNHSSDCHNFEDLAKAIIEVFEAMGVHGSLAIIKQEEVFYFADDGKDRRIESKLIQSVRDKYIADLVAQTNPKRILTSGARIVTVGFCCGLLLRDVPEEKIGRMRDIIAGLIAGLDARVQFLINQQRDEERQKLVKAILSSVNDTVSKFKLLFEESEQKSIDVIDEFMLTLNSGLAELALSQEQEQYFISAADTAMGTLVEQYKDQMVLRQKLDDIAANLAKLASIIKN